MKSRFLAIFIVLCMLLTLFPAVALADGETAMAMPIYESKSSEPGNPAYTFDPDEANSEDPIGLYVYGSGSIVLNENLSEIVLVVNESAVTLGEDGQIDYRNVIICGAGSILTNGLLIEGIAPAVPDDYDEAEIIFGFIAENALNKPLVFK